MELLDHQAPFIASLKKGTVSLWDEKKHHHYVDIDDGFVHIKDNQCIVITSLAKVWEKNQ
jgi:F0F1-type ATP synthase epsilon subunit